MAACPGAKIIVHPWSRDPYKNPYKSQRNHLKADVTRTGNLLLYDARWKWAGNTLLPANCYFPRCGAIPIHQTRDTINLHACLHNMRTQTVLKHKLYFEVMVMSDDLQSAKFYNDCRHKVYNIQSFKRCI
jgi:hypothetical protein